ncbi:MAG: 3-deoxy-manno-octulosonate cytidylyltransferase [Gammaproteobacteria bacterium]|nr:3-deoxy-manno-octulosonate cytidylyltransferase [Gammaproteobacteria bacterium]
MESFFVVIPSRYSSLRLPGKPLIDLNGKTMIQHVYECGLESGAKEIIIATESKLIAENAESFGAKVCMTSENHKSGMERITEVANLLNWDDAQIVVNLQGDEPLMPKSAIKECANLLIEKEADISTLASPFLSRNDFEDPNCVKVICNQYNNAIYFSRSPIPNEDFLEKKDFSMKVALHHHGIYAYRCGVLRQLIATNPPLIEKCEKLEQLRALSLGMKIAVCTPTERPGIGIDTIEDLQKVSKLI